MICPFCKQDDSRFKRTTEAHDMLYDMHECLVCGKEFVGEERLKLEERGGEPNPETEVEKELKQHKTEGKKPKKGV